MFDPYSQEWQDTDFDEKIRILKKLLPSGERLSAMIHEYKERYAAQHREDIASCVEDALPILPLYQLRTDPTDTPV